MDHDPHFNVIPADLNTHPKFNESILLMPTVSCANLSQLSLDLIISTFNLSQVATVECPYVLPIAGGDAISKKQSKSYRLCFPLEVYQSKSGLMTVVQQRTPVVKGQSKFFMKSLLDWVKKEQFRMVVIMSGADGIFRKDDQLEGTTIRVFISNALANLSPNFNDKNFFGVQPISFPDNVKSNYPLDLIPGTGALNYILQAELRVGSQTYGKELKAWRDIPFAAIVTWTLEGDNLPETYLTAKTTLALLSKISQSLGWKISADLNQFDSDDQGPIWNIPSSWHDLASLYGSQGKSMVELYQ